MKRRSARRRSWKLLTALSLLLTLTCCDTPATIKGCPEPLWPDLCTAEWLAATPHPSCVSRWKDHYDRQQNLLEQLK